jgi:hypothetical protein
MLTATRSRFGTDGPRLWSGASSTLWFRQRPKRVRPGANRSSQAAATAGAARGQGRTPLLAHGGPKDIEEFAGVRVGPGTLYGVLVRLEGEGLIEPLPNEGRRRPYRLTAAGSTALSLHLTSQKRTADVGLRRLATS